MTCSKSLLNKAAEKIDTKPDHLDSWIKKKLSPWNQGQAPGVSVPPAKSYRIFEIELFEDHIIVVACADRGVSYCKPPPAPRRMMFGIPLHKREVGKEIFYIR